MLCKKIFIKTHCTGALALDFRFAEVKGVVSNYRTKRPTCTGPTPTLTAWCSRYLRGWVCSCVLAGYWWWLTYSQASWLCNWLLVLPQSVSQSLWWSLSLIGILFILCVACMPRLISVQFRKEASKQTDRHDTERGCENSSSAAEPSQANQIQCININMWWINSIVVVNSSF